MKRILKDLYISRIACVDKPCQQGAVMTIMKRDMTEDNKNAAAEAIEKRLDALKVQILGKRLRMLQSVVKGGPGSGPRPGGGSRPNGMSQKSKVPVYDKRGTILGHVSGNSTSVGASKIAGGDVSYEKHPTHGWGWRLKKEADGIGVAAQLKKPKGPKKLKGASLGGTWG